MESKSIKLFLVDGTPAGLITAQIGQWTGRATVSSRQDVDRLLNREELKKPGVYLLIGEDPDEASVDRVYIGESENIPSRIKDHVSKKDFWTRVCVFTSSDRDLTKAHIRYIEYHLIRLAKNTGNCELDNGNDASESSLDEAGESDMQKFIEQVQLLLPVFGFRFLESIVVAKPNVNGNNEIDDERFEFESGIAKAYGKPVDDQFVVIAGSTIRSEEKVMLSSYKQLRDRLIKEERLVKHESSEDLMVFVSDYAFKSPSAAAAVVSGASPNGPAVWKLKKTRQSYKEWENAKIESVPFDI